MIFIALVLLIALISGLRLHPFPALIVTALFTGLCSGMAPAQVLLSIQNGAGSTLGGVVLVLGFGMMLGNLMVAQGVTEVIAKRLLGLFGNERATWALALTAFITGLAMFYNAGFIVLAPMVFSVAAQTKQSIVPLAIAMAAPLSVTHGFLPPHPGATTVANALHADLGKTLLYGIVVAIPAVVIAAILFPRYLAKQSFQTQPSAFAVSVEQVPRQLPPLGVSLLVTLLPIMLMAAATIAELSLPETNTTRIWLKFTGDSGIALLISVVVGVILLSFFAEQGFRQILNKITEGFGPLAALFLIIAAGGAFKQVFADSGQAKALADQFSTLALSPLILVWVIATLLRIAIGSATVAGITAAGIALPIINGSGTSPELATLAIGAGSLMCSHVNDSGFWMFREWFGVGLKDTFRSWTAMETIVGVVGLIMVLILNAILS